MSQQSEDPVEISLERLKAGDRVEFARLVDQYSTRIYHLALKMLNDVQDAEDVLQETFIKALRSVGEFEGRSSLSTWLYRIAVNEALMMIRKRKGAVVSLDETEGDNANQDAAPLQLTDWCCLPEQELASAEARRYLDEAVDRLPDALKVVFVLRDIQGLSIKETAEPLNLTEMAVKTRLFRARMKLRDDLSVYFSERLSEKPPE
jgi:RNA polymerase sigma-70 factor (ECF subfamily)